MPVVKRNKKKPVIPPEQKRLRIGWMWATKDQWLLHRTTKDALWAILRKDDFSVGDFIKALCVKEEWIEIQPEDKIPVNYPLYLSLWKHYLKVYTKMDPPLLYRMGIRRIGTFILTLLKEDSAYIERLGGVTQMIIRNPQMWPKNKQVRIESMKQLRDWWYREDWRERGKDKLYRLVTRIIDLYETEPFVTRTIDWFIDNLLLNADKWNYANGFFEPANWYPRGKGQINYIVHGRKA